jgi:site-specific recombinase XerD
MSDVNMDNRKLNILSKGGDQEPGYFSVLCSEYLVTWLAFRSSLTIQSKTNQSFFLSVGGGTPRAKLTPGGLRRILRVHGDKNGVEKVSPHAFRRSFATLRIKLGQSTRSVQVLGRWKDLKVFERYTQALLNDDDFGRESAGEFTPLRKVKTTH